ncbi:MAG: DUF480 domain-containing protein [Nevskia sp.]|nr:DUF480 domain-containing protein [Nevskia sp.]
MSDLVLSPAEARVLAVLVEKSMLTPQYYPMTVNAVMLAANQKTVRNPVMSLGEGETGAALNRLERDGLAARDDQSGRVPKWRHRMHNQLLLKPPEVAVLGALMLRGAQTLLELRANAQPLGGPGDAEALAATLASLQDRAQPLVTELPRQLGQKESRIAHLLCGPAAAAPAGVDSAPTPMHRHPGASLEQRLAALERRVAQLEERLAHLPQ